MPVEMSAAERGVRKLDLEVGRGFGVLRRSIVIEAAWLRADLDRAVRRYYAETGGRVPPKEVQ